MSEQEQLQEEEREVLLSIYEGDAAFKQLSPVVFQYKYGEDDDNKSFLVEIQWTPQYPEEEPTVNMDTFYNKHLVPEVKSQIKSYLLEEARQYLGCAMTYSLFESIKERVDELLGDQPDSNQSIAEVVTNIEKLNCNQEQSSKKAAPKKEQLSKAQKRRAWDRCGGGAGGVERPRGWNWVDLVKHLSQTGGKETTSQLLETTS